MSAGLQALLARWVAGLCGAQAGSAVRACETLGQGLAMVEWHVKEKGDGWWMSEWREVQEAVGAACWAEQEGQAELVQLRAAVQERSAAGLVRRLEELGVVHVVAAGKWGVRDGEDGETLLVGRLEEALAVWGRLRYGREEVGR
jgi:hypothetical protein